MIPDPSTFLGFGMFLDRGIIHGMLDDPILESRVVFCDIECILISICFGLLKLRPEFMIP